VEWSSGVQRNAANRFTSRILLSAIAAAASAAVCAGDIVGMTPTSRSPQFMFYVSQPLWSPGKSFRVYGLRIEEVRAQPTSRQSGAAGSMRRSELLDLQIGPHSDIRVELGRRVAWDFTRGAFGTQTSLSIVLPLKSIDFPDPARLQPWDVRASDPSLMAGRLIPDSQARGVSVTVAAAVLTLRWAPGVARPVTAVSGLATLAPLGRICGLWTCPGSWPDVDLENRRF
jgi:hypothetical protein